MRTFSSYSLSSRRDVALGVLERLLADVVGRHLVAVGVRDFEVVAEHRVEADLDVRDAGPLAFGGLVLGHPLLAAGRQLAQLVEIGAIAGADEAAVAGGERAVVDERLFERAADVGAQIEPLLRAAASSALARPVSLAFTFGRQASVRPTNAKIARAGAAGGHAGQAAAGCRKSARAIRGAAR